jgi:hypothetical protein
MPHHAAGRVAGEQGVFRQLHARRGAVAEALFRHEGGAQPPPAADREMTGGTAVDDDVVGVRRALFAGQRGKEFILAVAGHTGDTDDLAAADLQPHGFERNAVRIVGRE